MNLPIDYYPPEAYTMFGDEIPIEEYRGEPHYDTDRDNEQYAEWMLANDIESFTNRHLNVLFR